MQKNQNRAQVDGSDKVKKIKLVRADQASSNSQVRKEGVKRTSSGKPVSARINVMSSGSSTGHISTSNRENKYSSHHHHHYDQHNRY